MKKIITAISLMTSALCANNVEVVQKPMITIVGIECRTSNAQHAAPVDIPKLWGEFHTKGIFNQIPNRVSNQIHAVYCEYEKDHTEAYTLLIGLEVSSADDLPEGMVAKTFPASNYALHKVEEGEFPKTLIEKWQSIWSSDLPRTYTADFELYGENFHPGQAMDVYISVE